MTRTPRSNRAVALATLLAEVPVTAAALPEMTVSGVALDSRKVQPGDVFIAVPGTQVDGREFVPAAVANGAIAVIAAQELTGCDVPVVLVADVARHVSMIAGAFFGHPSRAMECVAVTGTNGKTSVAHFVSQLGARLGLATGFLGTTGWGMSDAPLAGAELTTADAVTLQARLADLRDQGAQLVALELSSHALDQHRADALAIDVAVFTNLSRDHLDYHGDMASYAAAKARLFEFASLRGIAVNAGDSFGADLLARANAVAPSRLGVFPRTCGSDAVGDMGLRIEHPKSSAAGLAWTLQSPWGAAALRSEIIGSYNVINLSLAVGALVLLGHPMASVAAHVGGLQAPAGRLQRVPAASDAPAVYVDYAHTPDALASVLGACREHCAGQLICVFGCGGDRDRGKRAPMGRAVASCADVGVLTSDNPRGERPQDIIQDVLDGLASDQQMRVEVDRRAAIELALSLATPSDLVLIAGKGHEDYQEVAGRRLPFDDRVVAAELLASWSSGPITSGGSR